MTTPQVQSGSGTGLYLRFVSRLVTGSYEALRLDSGSSEPHLGSRDTTVIHITDGTAYFSDNANI